MSKFASPCAAPMQTWSRAYRAYSPGPASMKGSAARWRARRLVRCAESSIPIAAVASLSCCWPPKTGGWGAELGVAGVQAAAATALWLRCFIL